MILAQNLEAPCCSWPFFSPLPAVCPDPTAVFFPQHLPRFVRVLLSFSPLVIRHPFIPSAVEGPLSSRGIMFPYKSFRSNTYRPLCKCSFQKTYCKAKSFSSNTYKKPGVGGDPLVHYTIASSGAPVTLPRTSPHRFLDFRSARVSFGENAVSPLSRANRKCFSARVTRSLL
jgi:hypothetical protein